MDELQKARRNLLIVAGIIIMYVIAGGSLEAVNTPAVSIKLKSPEYIIIFVWAILIYEIIRFKTLMPKDEKAREFIIKSSRFIPTPQINSTINNQIKRAEKNSIASLNFVRKLFRRKLEIQYYSDGILTQLTIKISWFTCFIPETINDFKTDLTDYIEYLFPLQVAALAFILHFQSLVNEIAPLLISDLL